MPISGAATAAALRSQSDIARAFERAGGVTKAVVGIGRREPGESTLYDADHGELRRLGVCGGVCGVCVDDEGATVDTALASRVIAIDAERLRAVPDVIAIAYGTARHRRRAPCCAAGS